MFFLMECRHHTGCDALRDRLRPDHREWVKSGGNGLTSVLIGSGLCDEDGRATGNWGVLEAENEENARAFADGDPFATGGVIAETRLTRLADGFQAHRVTERMTAR